MEKRTLIDVIAPDDAQKLCVANKQHAQLTLAAIVRRMPEPRAYLCEPVPDKDGLFPLLWDEGTEILGKLLVDNGISVVDPGTIRYLLAWPERIARLTGATDEWVDTAGELAKVASGRNPLMWLLVTSRTIQQVCLPEDPRLEKQNEAFIKGTAQLELVVRRWHPELTSRGQAVRRWGQPPPRKSKKPSRP